METSGGDELVISLGNVLYSPGIDAWGIEAPDVSEPSSSDYTSSVVTTLYIILTLFYVVDSLKSVWFPIDISQTRYQNQEILRSIDSDALRWLQPNLRYRYGISR
jgi:hypothetical protein